MKSFVGEEVRYAQEEDGAKVQAEGEERRKAVFAVIFRTVPARRREEKKEEEEEEVVVHRLF